MPVVKFLSICLLEVLCKPYNDSKLSKCNRWEGRHMLKKWDVTFESIKKTQSVVYSRKERVRKMRDHLQNSHLSWLSFIPKVTWFQNQIEVKRNQFPHAGQLLLWQCHQVTPIKKKHFRKEHFHISAGWLLTWRTEDDTGSLQQTNALFPPALKKIIRISFFFNLS